MKNLAIIVFCIVIQHFTGCSSQCPKYYLMLEESINEEFKNKTITPITLDEIHTYRLRTPYNLSNILGTLDEGCILNMKCESSEVINKITLNPSDARSSANETEPTKNESREVALVAAIAVASVVTTAAITYFIAKKILEMMQYGAYHLPA